MIPRKGFTPRPARQWEGKAPVVEPPRATLTRSDGKARLSVPVPKPEPCRPGKRTPTVEERAWMDAISAIGCIACRLDGHPDTPGEVHHLLRGGRRMGHMDTICLCPGHHRDGTGAPGLVARHPWRLRFERLYGSEMHLLNMTLRLMFAPRRP